MKQKVRLRNNIRIKLSMSSIGAKSDKKPPITYREVNQPLQISHTLSKAQQEVNTSIIPSEG